MFRSKIDSYRYSQTDIDRHKMHLYVCLGWKDVAGHGAATAGGRFGPLGLH